MKILGSSVAMASKHRAVKETTETESLNFWSSKGAALSGPSAEGRPKHMDIVELSREAQDQLSGLGTAQNSGESVYQISEEDKRKIELIQKLLERLTGKKLKFALPRQILLQMNSRSLSVQRHGEQGDQGRQGVGWGLIYNKTVTTRESEQTHFAVTASVKTEDGRQIDVDLSLSLSRQYQSSESLTIRAGDARQVDPLVINFGAASASVTNQKFSFDLDADGVTEMISFTGAGSGFLALDKNRDGVINNGNELFGPGSGNGFADLAAYDLDQNGWIDENDPVYQDLQIWSRDASGKDSLVAIGKQGVGAIYLGYISTVFTLKNTDNQTNAQIQKSGLFLREDGSAGTVQHVDLVI